MNDELPFGLGIKVQLIGFCQLLRGPLFRRNFNPELEVIFVLDVGEELSPLGFELFGNGMLVVLVEVGDEVDADGVGDVFGVVVRIDCVEIGNLFFLLRKILSTKIFELINIVKHVLEYFLFAFVLQLHQF